MADYVKGFRFFCQKVLPLVYDDSLSYYEVLCKAINKMNEINNVVNLHSDSIEDLGERYDDLSEKVEGLIENLVDVIEPWDSSVAYRIFTIVSYQGQNYIAVQDVPVGAMITNTDYWQPANTVIEQINAIGVVTEETQEKVDTVAESEPLNVLLLGVKNDGSEDCSEIINEATVDHELYFPAGVYRVDSTLVIEHSIYGCGNSRQFTRTKNFEGATLLSNIDTETSNDTAVIVSTGNGITIQGINIVCNSNENGIEVKNASTAKNFRICRCTIAEIGNAIGIYIAPVSRSSRSTYIEDCSIFGRGSETDSRGIELNNYAYDSVVRDTEIMAVKTGIKHDCHLRAHNVHIWTGFLDPELNVSWWDGTVCIISGEKLIADMLYLDSALVTLGIHTSHPIKLYNTTIWFDESMINSNRTDAILFNANTTYVSEPNVNLTVKGLTVRDNGKMRYWGPNILNAPNFKVEDVTLITDKEFNPNLWMPGMLGRIYFDDYYAFRCPASSLGEIARIAHQYGGTAEIEVTQDNAKVLVEYNRNSVTKKSVLGDMQLYYKEVTSTAGNYIIIYVQNSASSNRGITVHRTCSGNAYMTSYNVLTQNIVPYERDVLTSTDGLTEILAQA